MNNADRPTYPLPLQDGETSDHITKLSHVDGLTKREYFAALALNGICANSAENSPAGDWITCAKDAVKAADALLKELDS